MTPWTLPVDVTECVLYKIFFTYLGTQIVLYKEKDGELIFFASLGFRIYSVWLLLEHIFAVFKNFPPCIF